METITMAKPGVWEWQIDITRWRLPYAPDPDGVSGLLTFRGGHHNIEERRQRDTAEACGN